MMAILTVLLQAKAVLDTQRVAATRDGERAGQSSATATVVEARERGITTTAGMLALVPFVQLRSARGEAGITLRGARREQVVVTLDEVPLNDPATGTADLSDLPLVLLDRVVARPGAAPTVGNTGAVGGVVSLTSRSRSALAIGAGAFGQRIAEGLWAGAHRQSRLFLAIADRVGRNDFAFTNAVADESIRERRVNNDEHRSALAAGWVAPRQQLLVVATRTARGMVGPINVRAYDEDRAITERALVRWQGLMGPVMMRAGVRSFRLDYRDAANPGRDARSRVSATDLEWRGLLAGGTWQLGGSHDLLRASGGVTQERRRAFAAWDRQSTPAPHLTLDGGIRFDAVPGMAGTPSGHLGAALRVHEWAGGRALLYGRTARALRIPTLYDLFFHSPQRVTVRALRPELVSADLAVGIRANGGTTGGRSWRTDLALVHRRTRDAIVWFPGNFGWSPANVGRESLVGVEWQAAAEAERGTLSAWATIYDPVLHAGGLQIPTPYVARVHGGFAARWRPDSAWLASAQWRWQGARPYTAGPRNPSYELPGVPLLDLAVSRRIARGRQAVLMSVGLDNAMNAEWQSVRGFPMPGRAWSVTTSWPAR